MGGVLVAPYIEGQVKPTPLKTRLVHTYLSQQAFEPSWDFSQVFRFTPEMLVPWPALCEWMPVRVNSILDRLAREIAPADYRFLRIGHRGAAAHAPDNTLLGFRQAAALGADLVECDVRQTADGHVVLAHDAHLTRCGWPRPSSSAEARWPNCGPLTWAKASASRHWPKRLSCARRSNWARTSS